ncbi:MAG TPA: LptF/LptG family permease [Anaeromyxobacter sp.]|nr:LptF/LptG family permease [Anaeromyxobacter sp.]
MILFRYVAARTAWAVVAALVGVVTIYLAVDYVDNSGSYAGPGWIPAVLELYANMAVVVVRQVAPAAMLLGAGIAVSGLRRTREYTAMRAAGLGPFTVARPVVAVVLLFGAALVLVHDALGVQAVERVEEIRAFKFHKGGDQRRWEEARAPKRWFRGRDGRHVYHLRGTLPGGGFEGVTVLELSDDFRLLRRIDARAMRPQADGWLLDEVVDRRFLAEGRLEVEQAAQRLYRFDEPADAFAVVPGNPAQMRWGRLVEQIAVRSRTGLPVADFDLERDNRLAYPLAGVPGALLAIALALRPNRKGHIATALVESVGVSLVFWGVQGVTWALGLSGRVAPWLAAWAPDLAFLLVGFAAVWRSR